MVIAPNKKNNISDISTKWWQSVSKYPWIAVNTRLKFGIVKGAAPFQSGIIYLGDNLERFNSVFSKYGQLYIPYDGGQLSNSP